jgi:hypothetical protein
MKAKLRETIPSVLGSPSTNRYQIAAADLRWLAAQLLAHQEMRRLITPSVLIMHVWHKTDVEYNQDHLNEIGQQTWSLRAPLTMDKIVRFLGLILPPRILTGAKISWHDWRPSPENSRKEGQKAAPDTITLLRTRISIVQRATAYQCHV